MGQLVASRIEQIQSYLVTTPRLRQIRGGSRMLVDLEREVQAVVETRPSVKPPVVAAGGRVIAVFEGTTEDADARWAVDTIQTLARIHTPGARLSVSRGEWPPETGFGVALQRILARASQAGDDAGACLPVPDIAFVRLCDLCGAAPAATGWKIAERESVRGCVDCRKRHDADKAGRHPRVPESTFERIVRQLLNDGITPKGRRGGDATVEDLAHGTPPGYVGYLSADGNAVGREVRKTLAGERGLADYARFSQGLDDATVEAFGEAANRVAGPKRSERYQRRPSGSVMPVLVGGDDLFAFTSPGVAVPLAVAFAEAFERCTEKHTGTRMTTSVGVVIAHASTPYAALDGAAHRLQGLAKKLHRAQGGSTVAFRVVHGPTQQDWEDLENLGDTDDHRLLGVPAYRLDDTRRLLDSALELIREGAPRGRLRQLDGLLRRTDRAVVADFDLLLRAASMTERARTALRSVATLPEGSGAIDRSLWRRSAGEVVTALPDVVGLAEVL